MGNMRTVRLRPVRLGLGEISAFMLPEVNKSSNPTRNKVGQNVTTR